MDMFVHILSSSRPTMTIGVRAHDFGCGDYVTFDNIIRDIAKAGYQSLQLAPAKSITEIGDMENLCEEHLIRIKDILQRHQIKVSVLGCYLDFTSEDEQIRKKSVRIFKDYIKHAKFLDARMIATETSYSIITDEHREQAMGYVVEALQEIMPIAEEEGVLVAFEPVAYHALNTPEETRKLLETIKSDNLKILFDQANLLTPDTASEDEAMLVRAKECFGGDVIALHLKNFEVRDGEKHPAPLASGAVNISSILQWVKSEGLEVDIIREESTKEELRDDLVFIERCTN